MSFTFVCLLGNPRIIYIRNCIHTVYSLFADTPHKRTSPLNGHFLRDRQNMYGFANKIFPLKRTPY
jgi:hypothetical protein